MDNSSPMPGRRASADGIWSSRAHGSRHDLSAGVGFCNYGIAVECKGGFGGFGDRIGLAAAHRLI